METIGLHCMQDSHSLQVLNSSVPRFFQLWAGLVTENQSTRLQRTLNKIDKVGNFKSDLLKTNKDTAMQSRGILQTFVYYIVGSTFLPSNLVSYLNSRPFFQHRWWIFACCSYQKLRKPWKGLLSLPRNEIPNHSLPLQLDKTWIQSLIKVVLHSHALNVWYNSYKPTVSSTLTLACLPTFFASDTVFH